MKEILTRLTQHEKLSQQEQKASYDLKINGNKKRKSRTARMSLKYVKVKIKKRVFAEVGHYTFIQVSLWHQTYCDLKTQIIYLKKYK